METEIKESPKDVTGASGDAPSVLNEKSLNEINASNNKNNSLKEEQGDGDGLPNKNVDNMDTRGTATEKTNINDLSNSGMENIIESTANLKLTEDPNSEKDVLVPLPTTDSQSQVTCVSPNLPTEKLDENSNTNDSENTEEHEKALLRNHINEFEQRAEGKQRLRERNQAPQRPDDAALAKLDSSLKKNTAFVRKLPPNCHPPHAHPPTAIASPARRFFLQSGQTIGYGSFGVVWAVTDPRDGQRVALKKLPNVFKTLACSKRVFREIKMLCFVKHENVLSALDIVQLPHIDYFQDIYVMTELLQTDLHKIIVSAQCLTFDHITLLLYQLLRGLKYLHSARIIHRDLKPSNLLVSQNYLLKICDFGLARVEEPDQYKKMTPEVVTQYYRAPEILMGAPHYTAAIDIWSVGCIFSELLSRRVLFESRSTVCQLEMITDLLGTPSLEDMRHACAGARSYMLRQPVKPQALSWLYTLSDLANHEVVNLLCQMLVFNPDNRISVVEALDHPYLEKGRLRYHLLKCKCCYCNPNEPPVFLIDPEPVSQHSFEDLWEQKFNNIHQVKEEMYKFVREEQMKTTRWPICINPETASFPSFELSEVVNPSQLPPTPHQWE